MKYLKIFEEWSGYWDYENIEDFIENTEIHMIYLIDNGFTISYDGEGEHYFELHIKRDEKFKWSEVRDTIIPFLDILKEDFKFDSIKLYYQNGSRIFRTDNIIYKLLVNDEYPITKQNDGKVEEDLGRIVIENIRKL